MSPRLTEVNIACSVCDQPYTAAKTIEAWNQAADCEKLGRPSHACQVGDVVRRRYRSGLWLVVKQTVKFSSFDGVGSHEPAYLLYKLGPTLSKGRVHRILAEVNHYPLEKWPKFCEYELLLENADQKET